MPDRCPAGDHPTDDPSGGPCSACWRAIIDGSEQLILEPWVPLRLIETIDTRGRT